MCLRRAAGGEINGDGGLPEKKSLTHDAGSRVCLPVERKLISCLAAELGNRENPSTESKTRRQNTRKVRDNQISLWLYNEESLQFLQFHC